MKSQKSKETINQIQAEINFEIFSVFDDMPLAAIAMAMSGGECVPVYRNNAYYSRFGYTNPIEADLKDQFFDHFYDPDISRVREMVKKSFEGEAARKFFRMHSDDESWLWGYVQSYLMTAVTERPIVMVFVIDIADSHAAALADASTIGRYQIIAENANRLSFEYNVLTDEMFYIYHGEDDKISKKLISGYLRKQQKQKFIHPSSFREVQAVLTGKRHSNEMDFLMKGAGGSYHWVSARYRNIYPGNEGDHFVVGHVELTDQHKTAKFRMDRVSGMLDRMTAEQFMRLQLRDAVYTEPKAFVMFLIDGLADVDEACGIETGDLLIRKTASLIARHLSGDDVIGRYSGTMFFSLIRNSHLERDLKALLAHMKERMSEITRELNIPVSVELRTGGVLVEDAGADLDELIRQSEVQLAVDEE